MSVSTGSTWQLSSWRNRPIRQQPSYPDADRLENVLRRIRQLPPLVSVGEIENLRGQLAEAALGKRFVLQGGDCAERFVDCNGEAIIRKLKILLQMSLVLTYGARRPVVRIGRIAGQYAKPRSKDTELVGGVEMPAYRGDNVNDFAPDPALRVPDPERLERGYFVGSATLNYVRALVEGGFASLKAPEHWHLDFLPANGDHSGFREIADRIRDAIDYLESFGPLGASLKDVDFFTSHEALLLPYEEALTRRQREDAPYYNVGAHFLWIGERTRELDGAHVEYFRGVANPIGVKVGPSTTPDDLLALLERLDPARTPGRLMLISRMGADRVGKHLPPLSKAVQREGHRVVWSCDPMHGNTAVVEGWKTRRFEDIVAELRAAFAVHAAEGGRLSGVHFELTGDDVTECLGGVTGLGAADLSRVYETGCDPRLNYAQSMEIAFVISHLLKQEPRPSSPLPW